MNKLIVECVFVADLRDCAIVSCTKSELIKRAVIYRYKWMFKIAICV